MRKHLFERSLTVPLFGAGGGELLRISNGSDVTDFGWGQARGMTRSTNIRDAFAI